MIRAVGGTNVSKRASAPINDRLENGINLSLELRGPPASGLEVRLEVEGGVEARLLARLQP